MKDFFQNTNCSWSGIQQVQNHRWVCGYCSHKVSSDRGYKIGVHQDGSGPQVGGIYICPSCHGPSFAAPDKSFHPSAPLGSPIAHLPPNVDALYDEARRCSSQRCFTAAVLLCRKLLMNTAVAQGAATDKSFIEYIEYLADKGYVPPNGKVWVDRIRAKGNEATHEIAQMSEDDATKILGFTEMLLKFVYEFPGIAGEAGTDQTA